jgi:serine/threonine protein kinase
MEWVEGPTLRELCAGQPATRATVKQRVGYVEQAATALADLASKDRSAGNPSLHRDLKPSNCIIHDRRGLVLIDVSTLRLLDDGFDAAGWHTPQYTAPEVLAAPHWPRTPTADVYSLGALAAFCLTGESLTPDADNRAVLERAARRAGISDPGRLAAHVMTTLDPDPDRRPADPVAWGRRLVQLTRTKPPRALLVTAVAAVLALIAGFVLVGPPGLLHRDQQTPSPVTTTTTTPALPAGFAGSIDSPADGSDVKQCSYLTGTATFPDGWTLILAMQNLSNGDARRYVEVVFGYNEPRNLSTWRGAQYFGQKNDTVGQEYQVQLIAVPLAEARDWDNGNDDDSGGVLARRGVLLDTVRVNRVEGMVENFCEGP